MEDVEHVILHCTALDEQRNNMLNEINGLETKYGRKLFLPTENNLHLLLGKFPVDCSHEMIFETARIIAISVHQMYVLVLKNREGVG